MIAAAARAARHEPPLPMWQWPIDLSTYDQRPRLLRREAAALARRAKYPHRLGHWTPWFQEKLGRLAPPIIDACDHLDIRTRHLRCSIQHVLAQHMHRRRSTYWAWSEDTWHAIVGTSRVNFEAIADGPKCRAALVAVAMLLQRPIRVTRLGRFDRVGLAYRIFGQQEVDIGLARVREALRAWGYTLQTPAQSGLRLALCETFLTIKSPRLEDITIEALADLRQAIASSHSSLRGALMRLSRALVGLGILAEPLNPWAMNGDSTMTWPHRRRVSRKATDGEEKIPIAPEWVTCVERWCATSTLSPKALRAYASQLFVVGRWATATYSDAGVPARWTRDTAAAAVAMILRKRGGDWTLPVTHRRLKDPGRPLLPRTQLHYLNALACFFADCQEWEWIPRRFHPARAFAQPRSIAAKVNFQPRVISDDIWAKLVWAGLNLTEADLPSSWDNRHFYPLSMVRGVVLVWLFAGLRQDEIRRLRVGCIRYQSTDAAGSEGVCLLDVPVNKTSTAFTKPVDGVVGEAIRTWEQERPNQPPARDEKTGEQVHFLFSFRCARFSHGYLNRRLIPALCQKAGVPREDARGRITTHRARSTIATQLFNARQPLTLFELQAWLGHSSPHSTQHYARVTPTKLSRAYTDAQYFQRNLRTIDVLIDQDAVRRGVAAGEPWRFYDLGHGYCTYDFFDQCPHRMACAKCAFYRPKDSAKPLLVEGKTGLLRLKQEIPLTEAEVAAVDDGVAAFDTLLTRLTDVPTPAGPTPRQLEEDTASEPTTVRRA
jgi:Phage integrase family